MFVLVCSFWQAVHSSACVPPIFQDLDLGLKYELVENLGFAKCVSLTEPTSCSSSPLVPIRRQADAFRSLGLLLTGRPVRGLPSAPASPPPVAPSLIYLRGTTTWYITYLFSCSLLQPLEKPVDESRAWGVLSIVCHQCLDQRGSETARWALSKHCLSEWAAAP